MDMENSKEITTLPFIEETKNENGSKKQKKQPVQLKYISTSTADAASWKIIRDLDALIANILANNKEPYKVNIKYSIKNNDGGNTSNLKGKIKH